MSLGEDVNRLLYLYINLKSLGVEEIPTFNPNNYVAEPNKKLITPSYLDEGILLLHSTYYDDEISLLEQIEIKAGIPMSKPASVLRPMGYSCYNLDYDGITLEDVDLEPNLVLARGVRSTKDRDEFSTEFCLDIKQYGRYWVVLR